MPQSRLNIDECSAYDAPTKHVSLVVEEIAEQKKRLRVKRFLIRFAISTVSMGSRHISFSQSLIELNCVLISGAWIWIWIEILTSARAVVVLELE